MSKYAQLDASILASIAKCSKPWGSIHDEMVRLHPDMFPKTSGDWRVTDGRLQFLRKKGAIKPSRVGSSSLWEAT